MVSGEPDLLMMSYIPRVVAWRSAQVVNPHIQSNPWIVRGVLQACMQLPNILAISSVKIVNGFLPDPTSNGADSAKYPTNTQLFSPEKASVLVVGGVSSLALHCALDVPGMRNYPHLYTRS